MVVVTAFVTTIARARNGTKRGRVGREARPLRRDAGLSGVGLGIGRRWTDQDR